MGSRSIYKILLENQDSLTVVSGKSYDVFLYDVGKCVGERGPVYCLYMSW